MGRRVRGLDRSAGRAGGADVRGLFVDLRPGAAES